MTARVKICGLSTPETMQAALSAGADFVGLMFFPKSPRHVSFEKAGELADLARGRAKIVAVTVDADDALLEMIAKHVRPDFIQCHGAESPEQLAAIKALTGALAYKVLKVRDAAHVARAAVYADVSSFMMYDAMPPENAPLPGGNGLAFDWTILEKAPHPFMLAGGLNPGNVATAISVTGADMVDVSSGVESAPGIKDPALIRKFIEAARTAR
jgi:phosphoribosylanthranilate isomerase